MIKSNHMTTPNFCNNKSNYIFGKNHTNVNGKDQSNNSTHVLSGKLNVSKVISVCVPEKNSIERVRAEIVTWILTRLSHIKNVCAMRIYNFFHGEWQMCRLYYFLCRTNPSSYLSNGNAKYTSRTDIFYSLLFLTHFLRNHFWIWGSLWESTNFSSNIDEQHSYIPWIILGGIVMHNFFL